MGPNGFLSVMGTLFTYVFGNNYDLYDLLCNLRTLVDSLYCKKVYENVHFIMQTCSVDIMTFDFEFQGYLPLTGEDYR